MFRTWSKSLFGMDSVTCLLLVNLMGWYLPLVSITSSTTGRFPLVEAIGSRTWGKDFSQGSTRFGQFLIRFW